ncbi:putative repeat protein (TIGR03837 family) [Chitinivorax tropicus]|uniref:Protein-arginine rhamnosyltransferase n=1 Tax=Chitinivorax tropicus TaxID=714531 RepID=A0A840MSS7_9PROT|nr:elongation factor P maturation arginine rhamnosyltransferase EarP [Chitinivorax tropicus]MBB5019822.1 putative repeat protein (TIGR03837 family) [Chitinivorax tropicus]
MRRWDLFCTVIDNFGDIGVCWRLARQLQAEQGISVRLWVDDLAVFQRLCPAVATQCDQQQVQGVEIRHWRADFPRLSTIDMPDVVIEAFACDLPQTYVNAMAACRTPPVWLNLEYLSAEDWVSDCHGMASRHPRLPLTKYFFFPGFVANSGGLLFEPSVAAKRAGWDGDRHLHSLGVPAKPIGTLRISLFCYPNPALPALLAHWAQSTQPIQLLVPAGRASEQLANWSGRSCEPGANWQHDALSVSILPFTDQTAYDQLLWSADVNFVRGEDSFVRAQWAQQPFVWHIYPQSDDVHHVKLDAFLDRYLEACPDAEAVSQCWHAWNGRGDMVETWVAFAAALPALRSHGPAWAARLQALGDLAGNLARFVESKL